MGREVCCADPATQGLLNGKHRYTMIRGIGQCEILFQSTNKGNRRKRFYRCSPVQGAHPARCGSTCHLLGTRKPDIVFHLAGCAAGARDPRLVIPTFQSNLATTVNILMATGEYGTSRVVLPGSFEEPEEATVSPSSPYAASKWAASTYARMFHSLFGTPELVPYTILSLLRGKSPRLSSGRRKVDWIYIDDVIDGLLLLAQID
jgi:nucleoside-diphosphate-sugar epimerase